VKSPQELRHEALAKDVLMLSSAVAPGYGSIWFDDERVQRACDALGWSKYQAEVWVKQQYAVMDGAPG
jgi:hypothetical protein